MALTGACHRWQISTKKENLKGTAAQLCENLIGDVSTDSSDVQFSGAVFWSSLLHSSLPRSPKGIFLAKLSPSFSASGGGTRPFPVAERWAELVLKEFALQGEEEKAKTPHCY